MAIKFEWNVEKEVGNFRKHGISFHEAQSAFNDNLSLTIPDADHSIGEERFLLLGISSARHLIVVAHTERGDIVRIISARLATRNEQTAYENGV